MEKGTKNILSTLAVTAAVGGGFYLYNRGKKLLSGAKMQFALLGFRIHKMNRQEVQFAVKLRCYNPTNSPISIAINQVMANYKGAAIAYSTPDIKGLTIAPGSTQEPEILFQVPYLNLMGKGITTALLQNTDQLKADMTFVLTLSVNGETLTTTQSLTNDTMNGLGIVSGPRNTQNGKQYNHLIKRADGKDKAIKTGNVIDTVESCIDIIGSHFREVEELAVTLQGDALKTTCRNIFDFCYNYLQYHKDDDGTEQLRTPARSWLDGQIAFKQKNNADAGIDCDDYSIFVGSLLKCLGIPFKLRITKYDGRSNFQHIYVIVPDKDDSEGEIVIDPVLSKFDYQKPYSFEQSNFDMSPLQLAGLRGIDGLTGASSLGLPISVLSGLDLAGGTQAQANHEDLMAIISGVDFDDAINGLGNPEDDTLRYLIRTRNFLAKGDNQAKMAHIQNPQQFVDMLNQAIKYWHTDKRDAVLDKLAEIEVQLAENGLIKYDATALEGIAELDDNEIDGLGRGKRRKGRFFKAIKQAGKKVGSASKKVVKAVVRFNPLTIAIRGGLLAALRLNMFGISKKLQYAYLPNELANKHNIDPIQFAKLKKVHSKVRKLFKGLQGKDENLRNAILKGAKQKSPDFSLKGVDGIIGQLQTIADLGELGSLGVVATAASVSAASGVLAKIGSWLKPVKDIFNKVKGKAAVKKMARLTSQGKEVSEVLKQQANQYQQTQAQNAAEKEAYQNQMQQYEQNSQHLQRQYAKQFATNKTLPQTTLPSPSLSPMPPSPTPMPTASLKKGISKGAKIGIGFGVLALLGTGTYLMMRGDESPKRKIQRQPKKKQVLGSITLQ